MIKISVQPQHIPSQLKDSHQWVGWQAELTDDGRLNKRPKNATSGYNASSTDPSTWSSFEDAIAYSESKGSSYGVGYVFAADDPFLGLDLDNCRDADSGQLADWAQEIIDRCGSYTEVSPSGTGAKIFLQGQMPGPKHKASYHSGALEIYDQKRFFTVTGHRLPGTASEIKPNQGAIDQIYHQVFSQKDCSMPVVVPSTKPVLLDDQLLLEKARSAANSGKFEALWEGYWLAAGYSSASEADLALASMLAFWTGRDQQQMERLMRRSALNREKYQRDDYLPRTIATAIQSTTQVYDSSYGQVVRSGQRLTQAMGLVQGETYYYRQIQRGEETTHKQLSSFVIEPLQRVILKGEENLSADLITTDGSRHLVVFPRSSWNSKDSFMARLPALDLQWYGSSNDVQCLQAIVASYNLPRKVGTEKLGYHNYQNGLWVWPDSIQARQGLIEDPPLVYLPAGDRGELDDKLKPIILVGSESQLFLDTVFTEVLTLNRLEVVVPLLGWFMATPYKPQLIDHWGGFPHLSVAGTRGAGKSTLLRMMWRLTGFDAGQASRLFSCTESDFVLLKLISNTSSIPIILDEYKPYDMPPHRLKALTRLLRKSYDGQKEFRGRSDQTTTEYALTAPVAIAGEVSLSEGALLERIISVEMSPNDLTSQMRQSYATLQALPLNAFIWPYISFVLATDVSAQLKETELMAVDLLGGEDLPDRVCNNLKVMIFGFRQFIRFGQQQGILDPAESYEAVLEPALVAVKNAVCHPQGVTRLALDYLVDNLAVIAEMGRLESGIHYLTHQEQDQERVAIRLDVCLAEYRRFHRETQLTGELLDRSAYQKQLRENQERGGYVVDISRLVNFSELVDGKRKRAVLIDRQQAEGMGLDLSGFWR